MSHASGDVRFSDNKVMYFEYDGGVDICIPKLYETYEEMVENWRKWEWVEPKCNHEEEPVDICTSYGSGLVWQGTACRKCGMILEGRSPYCNEDRSQDLFE